MTDDILITGLGVTTPVGGDVESTWSALLAGTSGIIELTTDWAPQLPARLAGVMAVDPASRLDRVQARRMDRCMQAALVAAREAWSDAGLDPAGAVASGLDPERVAVVIGTGVGGLITLLDNHENLLNSGPRRVSPRMIQMNMPNGATATVSIEFGARGGAVTPVSACASGAEAIAHAMDLIRLDRADVVIAGGTETCVHPLTMAGFAQAQAMSTRNDDPTHASRPFDTGRDGFVLGEGAGIVIVERASSAAARGQRAHARLAGSRVTSDAYDMVHPHSEGDGQIRAMRGALKDAGLEASAVDHVNAHATSTPTGDMIEAKAIRTVFGEKPVVSATKSMTGHLLGAAGAVEAVITVLSLKNDIAPPTPTLQNAEPDLALDVTRAEPRSLTINAAVSNSFGFGGHNAALVFTKV